MIVGVGIGGDFEYCAYLSKKALVREIDDNPDPFYQKMEEKMLASINRTGIGPQGFGGQVTALKVNIEAYPTHIAGCRYVSIWAAMLPGMRMRCCNAKWDKLENMRQSQ